MYVHFLNHTELLATLINGLGSAKLSGEDYIQMGKDVMKQEQAFNLKAGMGEEADKLPDWMRTDPLPPLNEGLMYIRKKLMISGIFRMFLICLISL